MSSSARSRPASATSRRELLEGAALLAKAATRAREGDRALIEAAAATLADPQTPEAERRAQALAPELALACARHPDRSRSTLMAPARRDRRGPSACAVRLLV